MYRVALNELLTWKIKKNRKPLVLRGARQVGKTWLLKEFAKNNFAKMAYVNFESSKLLQSLFSDDYNIERIITAIQIETGIIIEPENTLIIFDEIQEAEGGITALKYFYENAPEYHITAAGSLLGVALHKKTSFPVGKVDFIDLYPLSFHEFLMAVDQEQLLNLIEKRDWTLIKSFKSRFINLLKQYYFIGGMPECINQYMESKSYSEVRQVQSNILAAYEQDFSKHAPKDIVPRIRMLWNSIPSQLSKENKKFIYSAIKTGGRAKDFELALSWLIDCGLIHKVNRITKPGIPLKAYEDFGAFKLFCMDVGLLAALGSIDAKTLLDGNAIFEEFKGALTEQYVLQQLKTNSNIVTYYWSAQSGRAEIDFVIQKEGKIIPIEVKAQENLKAKSLKTFYQKYTETNPIRTSMSDYREEEWLINLPLYALQMLYS